MWLALMLTAAVVGLQRPDLNRDSSSAVFTRVRSNGRYMIALIREGYERSSTFRELVALLQETNVIVSIQPLPCAGGRIRSCLVGVAGSRWERHIWIKVDPQHTIENRLIATIAHELQHAVEIAERPDVFDRPSAVRLYRAIAVGRCGEGVSEECETTRALATEQHVLAELSLAHWGEFAPAIVASEEKSENRRRNAFGRVSPKASARCLPSARPMPASANCSRRAPNGRRHSAAFSTRLRDSAESSTSESGYCDVYLPAAIPHKLRTQEKSS